MTCLIRITYLKAEIKKSGGESALNPSIIMPYSDFGELKSILLSSKNIKIESDKKLHEYMNVDIRFQENFLSELLMKSRTEIIKTIIELGDPMDVCHDTLSLNLAKMGYKFSIDELLLLNNPANSSGETIAHWMASHHHIFTVNELILLGNPSDSHNENVANYMTYYGHAFSINELLMLKKIGNGWERIVYWMAQRNENAFTTDELIILGNPVTSVNNGETIAHILMSKGRSFTKEEMKKLNI